MLRSKSDNFLLYIWNLRPKLSSFTIIICWVKALFLTLVTVRFGQDCEIFRSPPDQTSFIRSFERPYKRKITLNINILLDRYHLQKLIPTVIPIQNWLRSNLKVTLLPMKVGHHARFGAPYLTGTFFLTLYLKFTTKITEEMTPQTTLVAQFKVYLNLF